jgi:hypothetical protein
MVIRKKGIKKNVDDFDKAVDKVTSKLPESSATKQFVVRWKALKKRLDDLNDVVFG